MRQVTIPVTRLTQIVSALSPEPKLQLIDIIERPLALVKDDSDVKEQRTTASEGGPNLVTNKSNEFGQRLFIYAVILYY